MKKQKPQPIWYRCPDCKISISIGCTAFEDYIPTCPDCKKPMVKE